MPKTVAGNGMAIFINYVGRYLPEFGPAAPDDEDSWQRQHPRQHGQHWAAAVQWLLVVLEPKVIPKVLEWCKD